MTNRRPINQKFLYLFQTGTPGPGDLIIHPRRPWCIGEVYHDGDKVRVIMRDWAQEMTEEELQRMALEMKNKYFFIHLEPQKYEENMRRIEALVLKGSANLSKDELTELSRLQTAAQRYEQNHFPIEKPATTYGKLERARMEQQLRKKR